MKKTIVCIMVFLYCFSTTYSQGRGLYKKAVKNSSSNFSKSSQGQGLIFNSDDIAGNVFFTTGVAYCAGDAWASPFSKSILNGNNYKIGFGFEHIFPINVGYRVSLGYSNYSNDDGDGKHHGWGLYRNTTNMYELSIAGVYVKQLGSNYKVFKRNSIYTFVSGGLLKGYLNYPPEAYVGYKDFFSGVISFGFGYNFKINSLFTIGAEFRTHYALTDKIDGYPLVVKPGTFVLNDAMGDFSVKLGYRIF